MAACECPATNKSPRQHCEDQNGHVTESKRGLLAFGPVFGCLLDREKAQDHHQTTVGERFMAPGQLYTPDKHGRRMLVATKCLSSAQTCSFVLPRVLAFLMSTKTSLCHNKESVLPRIPPEVWRQMRSDNFVGWPGLQETIVDFYERQHLLQDNAWPLRTHGRPVFDGEFEDAIVQTHSLEHRGTQAHAPYPTSHFDLLPHGRNLESLEVMPPHRLGGRNANHPLFSLQRVVKFCHANMLAMLGMPNTTSDDLPSCTQIQDLPL